MLRYINLPLAGFLAFIEDGEAVRPYEDGVLAKFISLGRRGLREEGAPRAEGFAAAYGSLTNLTDGVTLPEGLRSFFVDLATLRAGKEVPALHVESRVFWRFHFDAMRDVALLHMLTHEPRERVRTNGVIAALENCIVYDTPNDDRRCLYHATNGFLPAGSGSRKGAAEKALRDRGVEGLPPEVEGYLSLLGRPYVFSAPYDGDDTLDGRIEWLGEHCEDITDSYAGKYLVVSRGPQGSLLSFLQDSLLALVSGAEPLQFCILCGGCAQEEYLAGSRSFDANICRMDLYRSREHYGLLLGECGFSEGDTERMLDTKHVGRRSRK